MLSAVSGFERDLLLERTAAGLAHARFAGKMLGRPKASNGKQEPAALERLAQGQAVAAVARELNTGPVQAARVSCGPNRIPSPESGRWRRSLPRSRHTCE